MYTIAELEYMGVSRGEQLKIRKLNHIVMQKAIVNGRRKYYYRKDQVIEILKMSGYTEIDEYIFAKRVVEL